MIPTLETDNRTFQAPWLILPEMYPEMIAKVRQPVPIMTDPSALLAYSGKTDEDLNYKLRGDVAIVNVTGGMTLHANHWSYYYRWSVYENLALGLQQLLDNSRVKTIICVFDSPGGTVFGLEEMVDLIFMARGKKRLIAFAQGYCTSAAYWIASAFDTVVASKGSFLGSIGSKIQFEDWSAHERRMGIATHTYVSKQSPHKSPSPGTAKGDRLFQDVVDHTGSKFVTGVSRNRGVSEEIVLEKFGEGWFLQSDKAVAVGSQLIQHILKSHANCTATNYANWYATSSGNSMPIKLQPVVPTGVQRNKWEQNYNRSSAPEIRFPVYKF